MSNINEFIKKHDHLICVDSDGCAMDTMDVKHFNCFAPCMVDEWGLAPWRDEILSRWNDINLYTMTRGINRFKGLAIALSEISKKYRPIEDVEDLVWWAENASELSNGALERLVASGAHPVFAKALAWSRAVNKAITELPPEEVRALEEEAASIKGSRYALVKNPEDLTDGQRARLEALKKRAGSRLVRAWELKEDLRAVFRAADGSEAAELLDDWMHRAAYCKIAKVVAVEKKVRRRRDDIIAAVELGISNGRVEAINNKIKVTVRMGYGFRNTDNLVALLMLRCGDCQPQLPGRPVKARKKGVKGAKSVAA